MLYLYAEVADSPLYCLTRPLVWLVKAACFFLNDWSWLKVGLLKPTENVCKQTKPTESVWSQFQMTKNNHSRPKWIASSRLKPTQVDWTGSVDLSRFQLVWVGLSRFELISVDLRRFTWVDCGCFQKADFQSTSVVQEKASWRDYTGPTYLMPFVLSLQQTFKRALSKRYFLWLYVALQFFWCKILINSF